MNAEQIRQVWDDIVFEECDKTGVAWDAVRIRASEAIAERLVAQRLLLRELQNHLRFELGLARTPEQHGMAMRFIERIEETLNGVQLGNDHSNQG